MINMKKLKLNILKLNNEIVIVIYNPTISIEDRSVWYILYFCNSSYAEVQMENANRRSSKFNLPWLIENTEKSSTSSAFFQFSPFVNALCFCFNPDSLINDLFICLRSSILCCTDHGQIVKLSQEVSTKWNKKIEKYEVKLPLEGNPKFCYVNLWLLIMAEITSCIK